MTDPSQTPTASSRPSSDVTALLSELARVIKGRRFYGPGSPRLAKLFERAVRAWQADLERHGDFDVSVVDAGFAAPGAPAEPLSGQLATLHGVLVQRGVERLHIESPLEGDGFAALLEVLVSDAARLAEEGGVERALYSRAPVGFEINGIAPPSAASTPPASDPEAPQAGSGETRQAEPQASPASVAPPSTPDPEATDPMLDWAPPSGPESGPEPVPDAPEALRANPEPSPAPELRDVPVETTSPVPPVGADAPSADPGAVEVECTPESALAAEPPPAVAADAMPPIPSALLEEAAVEAAASAPAEDLDTLDFAVDLPDASAPETHETPEPDPVAFLSEGADEGADGSGESDAPVETLEASEPPAKDPRLAEDSGDADLPVLAEAPDLGPDLAPDADLPALAEESQCDPDADTLSSRTPLVAPPPADATPAPVENPAFAFMDESPVAGVAEGAESPDEDTQPDPEPLSAALSDFELEPLEDSSPNLDGPAFAPVAGRPEPADDGDALAGSLDPVPIAPTQETDFDDSVDAGDSFEAEVRQVLDLGDQAVEPTNSEPPEASGGEAPELQTSDAKDIGDAPTPDPLESVEFETPQFAAADPSPADPDPMEAESLDLQTSSAPEPDELGFEIDDPAEEDLGAPDEPLEAFGDTDEIGVDFGGESLELDETAADPDDLGAMDATDEPGTPSPEHDEEPLEFGFDDDARAPEIAEVATPEPALSPDLASDTDAEGPDVARGAPEIESVEAAPPEAALTAPPAEPGPKPEESPSYVFEILSELEECDDPILYRELSQSAADAAGRLVEKSFSAEAFTVLRTLAAHAGDGTKRSADQRSAAGGQMLSLARGPLLAELIQRACSDGDGSLEANQILLQLGSDATLPVFKAAAVERGAERRERLHGVLIALGEDSLPDLLRLMRDSDPVQVRTAVRLAGEIQNPGAVPRLAELLDQPVAALSQEVCKALVRIGDTAALKVLCDGLVSGTEHVPALAAYGLGSSGSPIAGAALLQALHSAMDGGQSEIARELIRALGRLGRPEATSDLAGILLRGGLWQRRRHRELKLAAAAALGRLPGDEAVGALAQAAQSRDAHIRRAAQVALDRRAQALAQG